MSWKSRGVGHSRYVRPKVANVVLNLHCSICDETPCFLLSTASMAVLQEQLLRPPEDNDLIAAVRYVQSLERLQSCLTRHMEVAREAWQLDQHFRVSEEALAALNRPQGDHTELDTTISRREQEGSTN